MIGSYSDNSLFIVNREDSFNSTGINPERILKYNLDTNESSERLFFNSDFVSKQLHISNNELFAVGGQFINSYDIDLENDPDTQSHGIENFCPLINETIEGITRHGMAVQNDDIYIIGGSLSNRNPITVINNECPIIANTIYKWNILTQTLTEFAFLPSPIFYGRGTIINNNLYVFGGRQYFLGEGEIYDTIYIVNLETGEVETQNLPFPIDTPFVDKYDSLIYVGGQTEITDADETQIGYDFTLGVFDTQTNTYTTLDTNLTQENPFDTIHQMCIFNDALYILFGSQNNDNDPDELDTWDIKRVSLN